MKRVRKLSFDRCSTLPVSAACTVANGVRETLAALYGSTVTLRLFQPVIPSPRAWEAITTGAAIFRVRGAQTEAAVILSGADARQLVAAAFGEPAGGAPELSAIERSVLERTVQAIALQFTPIGGAGFSPNTIERMNDVRGFTTYFELRLDQPIRARIGVALQRDPASPVHAARGIEALGELSLELRVRIDAGMHSAAALAALEPGALLALPSGAQGTAMLAGRPLAVGECGVYDRHFALAVQCVASERDETAR